MQVVYPVCCGIDVHQAQLTACLRRVSPEGQITTELRECGTTYPELLALSDWLIEHHCPVVAMESTGVYWRPVYHVLAGTMEVLVGNARGMRPRPGNKTDKADATGSPSCWRMGSSAPALCRPPRSAPCAI
jgi:transposase